MAQGWKVERISAAPHRSDMAALPCLATGAVFENYGFTVRGTFIDGPVEWFDVAGGARRARSAPPRGVRLCGEPGSPGARRPILPVLERSKIVRHKARDRSPSADSEASTDVGTPPSDTPHSDFQTPSESSRHCHGEFPEEPRERAEQLAALVEYHCAFLRLNGYGLQHHRADKASRRGTLMTVRFYVRGLPPAKRSKWQHPLSWAVKGVLSKLGCEADVVGGELRVPHDQDGTFIRIDFAPGRL